MRVRRATMADARLLWLWANDPDTRAASFSPDPILYPDHVSWLGDRLADRSCLLLIRGNGAGPLGQVRFDSRGAEAEVSISVAPEHRGTVGGLLLVLWMLFRASKLSAGPAVAYAGSLVSLLVAYEATNAFFFSFNWLIIGAALAFAVRTLHAHTSQSGPTA